MFVNDLVELRLDRHVQNYEQYDQMKQRAFHQGQYMQVPLRGGRDAEFQIAVRRLVELKFTEQSAQIHVLDEELRRVMKLRD